MAYNGFAKFSKGPPWAPTEQKALMERAKLSGMADAVDVAWFARLRFESRIRTGDRRDKVFATVEAARIMGRVHAWVEDPKFDVPHTPWGGEQAHDVMLARQMDDWDDEKGEFLHADLFWFTKGAPGEPPRI
ncbi:hypothetical protein EDF18_0948 [Frigoribacterium sp. PhB107]|nr:hypothetical protein EDF18_0948 [Frigoribacterium sp. PhB107]